jgi:hypothetical protein
VDYEEPVGSMGEDEEPKAEVELSILFPSHPNKGLQMLWGLGLLRVWLAGQGGATRLFGWVSPPRSWVCRTVIPAGAIVTALVGVNNKGDYPIVVNQLQGSLRCVPLGSKRNPRQRNLPPPPLPAFPSL